MLVAASEMRWRHSAGNTRLILQGDQNVAVPILQGGQYTTFKSLWAKQKNSFSFAITLFQIDPLVYKLYLIVCTLTNPGVNM